MVQIKIKALKTKIKLVEDIKENMHIKFSVNMFDDFWTEILDNIFIHKIIIKTKNITKEEPISLFKNIHILIKENITTLALFKIDNKIIYENKQVGKFYGDKYNCFKTKFSKDEFFFKKYENNIQLMPRSLTIDEVDNKLKIKYQMSFDEYSISLDDVIFIQKDIV